MGSFVKRYRWWLLALVPVLALLLWSLATLLVGPKNPITLAKAEQVRGGMTQEEVEAILGPPGDDTKGPPRGMPTYDSSFKHGKSECWRSDAARATSEACEG